MPNNSHAAKLTRAGMSARGSGRPHAKHLRPGGMNSVRVRLSQKGRVNIKRLGTEDQETALDGPVFNKVNEFRLTDQLIIVRRYPWVGGTGGKSGAAGGKIGITLAPSDIFRPKTQLP